MAFPDVHYSMPQFIIYAVTILFLSIASITDLKKREVPDWLNYGSIAVGLGFNLIFSLIYSNYSFIINSMLGFGVFYALAYLLFYTGQWGGGDSKALMGIGSLLGLGYDFSQMPFIALFLFNTLLAGAAYGLVWTIFLAVRNRNSFRKETSSILKDKNVVIAKIILLAFAAIVFIAIFLPVFRPFKLLIVGLLLIAYTTFYVWVLTKAVEKSCMQKYVIPTALTEGDWIVNDIRISGKRICGPKDFGIEKKQINLLIKYYKAGKIRKVLIKEGIPFIPSFLMGFIITLVFGNVLLYLM
ncbi:prepilin peptidase [Candidatus Woesearchaeota archaeon]|nr:prepilin peptidase [Candidatus Woesearchaeota archaeon]